MRYINWELSILKWLAVVGFFAIIEWRHRHDIRD